jgi:hypothetical protein
MATVAGGLIKPLLAASVLSALLCAPAISQTPCERACLEGVIDDYLEALVAHAPDRLAFADNVKFTENGQVLPLNRGLWITASKNADYRLYFSDPPAGQVGFFGLLEEHGEPVVLALRLRVAEGQIMEIEHIVARLAAGGMGDVANLVEPRPILSKALTPGARVPRERMAAIADSYFSGLDELNTGEFVPFHDDCQRAENGVETANASDPKAAGMRALGCAEQLKLGFSKFITDIRERRFAIMDEERGLVFAIAFFDHAGNVAAVELTNGETLQVSEDFRRPRTWMSGELFKIENGLIRQIEAVLVDVPYRMPSGW